MSVKEHLALVVMILMICFGCVLLITTVFIEDNQPSSKVDVDCIMEHDITCIEGQEYVMVPTARSNIYRLIYTERGCEVE